MKNIHILSTDKPSKIGHIFESESYHIFTNGENPNDIADNLAFYRNIYITSDEEIKEVDWCLCSEELIHKVVEIKSNIGIIRFQDGNTEVLNACKKIILTTDYELIKDCVQSIDDDFLEWFVKNPSCEEVEVVKTAPIRPFGSLYIIIIPKEIHILELGQIIPKDKPKQEPLEEAAERLFQSEKDREIFQRGDKWQQEQYSTKYLVDNNCHIWNGDAYKNYCKEYWNLSFIQDKIEYGSSFYNHDTEDYIFEELTQDEFINKIKTDDEFAKKWGVYPIG